MDTNLILTILTLLSILMVSLFIALFLMFMNLKKWATSRDNYYTQKFSNNEEAIQIIAEVKELLKHLNKQYQHEN